MDFIRRNPAANQIIFSTIKISGCYGAYQPIGLLSQNIFVFALGKLEEKIRQFLGKTVIFLPIHDVFPFQISKVYN